MSPPKLPRDTPITYIFKPSAKTAVMDRSFVSDLSHSFDMIITSHNTLYVIPVPVLLILLGNNFNLFWPYSIKACLGHGAAINKPLWFYHRFHYIISSWTNAQTHFILLCVLIQPLNYKNKKCYNQNPYIKQEGKDQHLKKMMKQSNKISIISSVKDICKTWDSRKIVIMDSRSQPEYLMQLLILIESIFIEIKW